MKKFSCVVVGAGSISGAWFPRLKAEKVLVKGVVDLNLERARVNMAKHGIKADVSDNLEQTLSRHRPDFVVDLTVPDAHAAVTCKALAAGCHVIGEKPMASSMAEARRMVSAAEKAGLIYMVSQSRRYVPRHKALGKAIARGKIGGLTSLNCDFFMGCHFAGFRSEMDSPLILDMSIHHFDLARMISGADPVSVYAHEYNPAGSWYKGDVAANCIFEMSNGLIFTYRGSWCAEGMKTSWHGDWRIIGEKGTILYQRDNQPVVETVSGKTGFFRKTRQSQVADAAMRYQGQHGALREFLAALDGGATPQGECHDNIKSLAMVFGAIKSSRTGRRVRLD